MESKFVESPAIAPDLRRTNSSQSASLEAGSNSNNELKDLQHLPEERRGPAQELANMTPEEYSAFEKKTLRKMDIRIIPWITQVAINNDLGGVADMSAACSTSFLSWTGCE